MSQNEPSPFAASEGLNRRAFLKGSTGVAFAFLLPGCGGSFDDTFSGSSGPNLGPNSGATPVEGTTVVTGRVDTAEIGGQGLSVQSAFMGDSALASGGEFTTVVSDNGAQLLLITDSAGKIRGLTVWMPPVSGSEGELLTANANSTALSLLLLTPGILTTDPEGVRIQKALFANSAPFNQLTAFLASRLPDSALDDLLTEPALQALITASIDFFVAQGSLAKEVIDPLEGLLRGELTAGERDNDPVDIALSNGAWRYCSVIRQELDALGLESVPHGPPKLLGGLVADIEVGDLIGGNTPLSFGSLATLTFNPANAGTASEKFRPAPNSRKVRYWFYGPGLNSASISELSPVNESEFSNTSLSASLLAYGLLPVVDFLGGVVDFKDFQKIILAWVGVVSGKISSDGVRSALQAGDSVGYITTATDFLLLATGFAGGLAEVLASQVGLDPVRIEKTTAALKLLGQVQGAMAAINLTITLLNLLRLPRLTHLTMDLPLGKNLERLGAADEIEVLDLNDSGTMVYNAAGALFYRKPGEEPIQLLDVPGLARLNTDGDVLYQQADHQDHARVRLNEGDTLLFPPPTGSLNEFAQELVAISPRRRLGEQDQGFFAYAFAVRADGKGDLYAKTTGGTASSLATTFINAPEGTGLPDITIRGSGATIMAGSGRIGERTTDPWLGYPVSGVISYAHPTRVWSKEEAIYPSFGPFSSLSLRDLNDKDEFLIHETWFMANDSEKPPEMPWDIWVQAGYQILSEHRRAYVRGPFGTFEVHSTDDLRDGTVAERFSVAGLNNEGEVIGSVTDSARVTYPALWERSRPPQDIRTLFPAGAPVEGTWQARLIAGKFILLDYRAQTPEGEINDVYLFQRGNP